MPDSITFVIPGIPEESSTRGAGATTLPPPPIGRIKQSVLVTSARGGGEGQQRVDARPGEDVVVLHIAGGPELWLHPESARDLLMSQYDPGSIARGAEPQIVDGGVQVPTRLQWRLEQAAPSRGATRGFLGDVLMRAIRVVTDLGEEKLADLSAEAIARRFDGQVDPGVYQLEPTQLAPLKGGSHSPIAASSDASLVLIHGTFSQTAGTFGKLWTNHPSLVRTLFSNYDGRVYALDHPTLAESPIANALMLAEAAPDGGRLHLLTHSRGGLVAEVLASACADPARSTDPLKADKNAVSEMKALAAIVKKKKLQIDRVVRVACPARGTLLASKRLDAYLSVIRWALQLAEIPVAPELVSFLGEVARRRLDPDLLPGLAAQVPDSPLVTWLHASTAAIPGDLRVVAGDIQGDSVLSWVKTLLSDSFYWTDNDLVVQTRSMYGGSARASASKFILDRGGKVTHFNYFGNPQTAAAAVDALKNGSPEGFNTIGPLSWSGESGNGTRAAISTRSP